MVPGLPCNGGFARTPTIYGGWLFGAKGVEFELSSDNQVVGALEALKISYDFKGPWLGVAHQFQPMDSVGLFVGTWLLIDQGGHCAQRYTTTPVLEERWRPSTDNRILDTAITVNIGGPFEVLGGFKFDYFSSSFKDRQIAPQAITVGTEAEAASYGYAPYAGIQFRRVSNMGTLTLKLVGAPLYPGSFDYKESINPTARINVSGEYSKGRNIETFLEFSRTLLGSADIGGFFNWSHIRAESDTNFAATGFGSGDYDLVLNKNFWATGLRVSLTVSPW
jgi:hypothetical protein